MRRAPWAAAAVLLFASCAGEPRLMAVLEYRGFRPGCLSLIATPEGAAQALAPVELPLASVEPEGVRRVAVFPPRGQGPRVALEARAHEQSCGGPVVARAVEPGGLAGAGGAQVTLELEASDPDDDGFISTSAELPGRDCGEGDPSVHPKPDGESACDGVDDDCAGGADDTFGVGQPCQDGVCQGTLICAGPAQVRCSDGPAWYEDADRDGAGGPFAGFSCTPDAGWVMAGGDCDDADAYVHPGSPEVCDGKDDDCNGAADDLPGGTCARMPVPAAADLLVVHSQARGRAWAAGRDGGLFALTADGGVLDRSGLCGGHDWRALWVDRFDRPYLGAPAGRMAYVHDAGGGGCTSTSLGSVNQVNGAWGYPTADGGTQVYFVTSTAHLVRWTPPTAPVSVTQTGSGNDNMRALDGRAPYPRLSTGWYFDGVLHPRVWLDRTSGGFVDLGAEAAAGSGIALYSATMPRADLAYACGDQGRVLAWDGGTLFRLPDPSVTMPNLNSIIAFDDRHVYAAGFDGEASWIWAWDGARWSAVMRLDGTAGSVRALGGTGPDDLWAVGRAGAWHLSLSP